MSDRPARSGGTTAAAGELVDAPMSPTTAANELDRARRRRRETTAAAGAGMTDLVNIRSPAARPSATASCHGARRRERHRDRVRNASRVRGGAFFAQNRRVESLPRQSNVTASGAVKVKWI
jgi:hypothetical protein